MVNGRTPLYLTLLAAALFLAGLLIFQPYSADWPGSDYAKPARRYIRAAIRQDSVGLTRLSTSGMPVAWALNAARTQPALLALWAGHTHASTGQRRSDTAEVFLFPGGKQCEQDPIVFHFLGSGDDARVLQVSSACLQGVKE